MSVKHLRTALAALALVTVAAVPAQADPWAYDAAQSAATSPAHTGAGSPDQALQARSKGLNERYGLGGSSPKPLVVYQDSSSSGFDWSSAGVGAVITLVAAGAAVVTIRRRPPVAS
jgi:hypothetical protein